MDAEPIISFSKKIQIPKLAWHPLLTVQLYLAHHFSWDYPLRCQDKNKHN